MGACLDSEEKVQPAPKDKKVARDTKNVDAKGSNASDATKIGKKD